MEEIYEVSSDGQRMEERTTINVHIPNQPVQVQCLPSDHTGLIQSPNGTIQTIQVQQEDSDSEGDDKCRDVIDDGQRDSYGWILNDLSEGQDVVTKQEDDPDNVSLQDANRSVARLQTMVKTQVELEEDGCSSANPDDSQEEQLAVVNLRPEGVAAQLGTIQYQAGNIMKVVPVSSIQMAQNDQTHGLQTLTMSNGNSNNGGATLVQYNGPDGQFFIPVSSIPSNNVQAYQISSPTTLPQGVVMTSAVSSNTHQLTEEASRKRELRLLKNRDAAKECRRKKKDYVKCLENRVSALEDQNKKLIDELKILKGLYCAKE